MEAFAAAVCAGADGVETDVRVSRDELPVLVHDRVVAGRAVRDMTRAEIERALGYRVATLDEALAAFPDLFWNVELKTMAAVAPVVDKVQKSEAARLLITSFRHDAIVAAAQRLDIDCGLLIADRPLSLDGLIDPAERLENIRTLVWDFEILDSELVAEARSKGWRSLAYGMVTLEEHHACSALGLDGLITDHVERGLEARP